MNGFCVVYIGSKNMIHLGFYNNDLRNGNWMSMNGTNYDVIESGWYKDGVR